MTSPEATIHASAVCVGDRAILIRGPSGSGKSRLAFNLILAGSAGTIPETVLVGDDRLRVASQDSFLTVQAVSELAGLIEIRGLGLRRTDFVEQATVSLVVDLAAADAERLPPPDSLKIRISGVELPRIPVAQGYDPLPLVLAFLTTS